MDYKYLSTIPEYLCAKGTLWVIQGIGNSNFIFLVKFKALDQELFIMFYQHDIELAQDLIAPLYSQLQHPNQNTIRTDHCV